MKKILALLLALVMVLGLAACAPKDNADDTKPADTKPADTKPADKDTEPAGNGIIPAAELSHDEAVTIKFVLQAKTQFTGRDKVMAEAAKYVKEKLNVDLEYIYIEDGDTPETLYTTGKGWDVGYCAAKTFQNMAARNAFLALDDYIEAGYLAYPVENLTEGQKMAHQINGQQVGFAPIKDLMEGWNLIYNATVLEDELGLTIPDWQSCFDLVPFWREIKEATKGTEWENTYPMGHGNNYLPAWFQIDGIVGSWNSVLVATNIDLDKLESFDDIDPYTAFCPYFTEDFTEWVKLRKDLIAEGIEKGFKRDSGETTSLEKGDWFFSMPCGNITYASPANDHDWVFKMKNQTAAYGYTSYVQAVSCVVNANTENPERVLEFLNLTYEDDYWNTLVRAGIEGYHWEETNGDGAVEWIGPNAVGDGTYDWRYWYGNSYSNSLLSGHVDPGGVSREAFSKALIELNQNGVATPHMGFVFDQTPVVDKITACSAVVAEYMGQLQWPASVADVDATVKAFQEKLIANGVEDIIAEVQAQLDAFHGK